jgi:dipeptidyl aminopeptidase/acylaminoacyl peptidase
MPAVGVSAEESLRPFNAMDVFDLEWVSDPQVAPDGNRVVYVRRSNDIMSDRTRSYLWRIDADGNNHRPLLSNNDNAYSPRWSPEGNRLAFISSSTGSSQIHVRWMDNGDVAVVTHLQSSPSNLSWSPDGRWLAFTLSVKAPTEPMVKPRSKPKGATWADKPITVSTTRYQYDGRGIVAPSYRHVFVVPAEGGSARQLTTGDFNHSGALSWSSDSQQIFFSAYRQDDWELVSGEADIYAVDITSKTLTQITREPGAERNPQVSPNGRMLTFTHQVRRPLAFTPDKIAVSKLDGSDLQIISGDLDGDASGLIWSKDSQSIFYLYDERGERKVGKASLKGELRKVVSGLGGTTIGRPYLSGGFHVASNTIAFTRGRSDRPADLAIMKKGKTRVITSLNEDVLPFRQLGKVQELVYTSSHDSQEIQGWYITPPNFDPSKKYPLILEIHGGPHLAYGPNFSAELQMMAAQGYVVFYDNHRGSLSYGEDFALLLQYKYSSKEDFADHMSGIDALIKKGFIDDRNLFIAGGSAGGIAAAYAIGLTDRFNAAVAAKPVINWVSKTLTADSMVGQIYHQFPGPPWEHLDHYWKRSPLSLIGNVTTPTMLLTGENDRRTPMSETEQFYQALRLKGVDSVMIRMPGASHGIASRPSRLVSKVDHILAWFERYKKADDAAEKGAKDD